MASYPFSFSVLWTWHNTGSQQHFPGTPSSDILPLWNLLFFTSFFSYIHQKKKSPVLIIVLSQGNNHFCAQKRVHCPGHFKKNASTLQTYFSQLGAYYTVSSTSLFPSKTLNLTEDHYRSQSCRIWIWGGAEKEAPIQHPSLLYAIYITQNPLSFAANHAPPVRWTNTVAWILI